MTKPSNRPYGDHLKALIEAVLEDNKAEDIVAIDLAGKTDFADYMIVATGRSQKHVSSLADHLADALKADGMALLSIEGQEKGDWVLVDAGDVIAHIFHPDTRHTYNLEKMWAVALPEPKSAELAV